MLSELSFILVLVILNGVFAAAEIAVISLRGSRLDALVASGSRQARAVKRLRGEPERFFASVQIGITVVGVVASAFGGATIAAHLQTAIARVPWLAPHAESAALTIVVALVSYLSLVIGELIPKSLALRYGERYALLIAQPLLGLSWLNREPDSGRKPTAARPAGSPRLSCRGGWLAAVSWAFRKPRLRGRGNPERPTDADPCGFGGEIRFPAK